MQKKYWIFTGIILLLILGGALFSGRMGLFANSSDPTNASGVMAQQTLNKTFSFPVTDNTGQNVTQILYTVTTVDKQNEVIIKGQRASAVAGKAFLIVNIKLTNTSSQTIQLNSRDYIRMTEGKDNALFAADLYNDPIVIQPISTEYTHIGFPVDNSQNTFVLHVGEISGPKTEISIHL